MFSDKDTHLIKQLALSGGYAGAGVGAGVGIYQYLKYLADRSNQKAQQKRYDDDVMYMDMPVDNTIQKQASPLGTGVAVTGSLLTGIVGYLLARKASQAMQKKTLQNDLDQSQQMYLGNIMNKDASVVDSIPRRPLSNSELGFSSPVSLALISALAGGITSYKALESQFPLADYKKNLRRKPKQLKLRYTYQGKPIPGEEATVPVADDSNESEVVKTAHVLDDNDYRHIEEFLCNISWGMTKRSFVRDLVYAVDKEGLTAIEDKIQEGNILDFVDTLPDAQYVDSDVARVIMSKLAHSEVVRPIAYILSATTFSDNAPYFYKKAGVLDEEDKVLLCKLAAEMNKENMHSFMHSLGDLGKIDPEENDAETEIDGSEETKQTALDKLLEVVKAREHKDPIDKALAVS